MVIGVPKEIYPAERRVALVPGVIPNLKKAGMEVVVQAGAGNEAGYPDAEFEAKGAKILPDRAQVFATADVILQVLCYGANDRNGANDLPLFRPGQAVIGFLRPLGSVDTVRQLAGTGVSAFSFELMPRITRAQNMDALSSMATVSGYKAVLLAADRLPPGLTSVGSGAVPPEIDLLLRELVLTDPYRWREAAGWAKGGGAGDLPPESVGLRLRAEAALRESEERYRMLVENATDCAIYMLDPAGCVSTWNTGAERIKGYRASEVIGKHFSIFYPPEDVEKGEPQLTLQRTLQDGHFESDGWRLRKDGTRYWANVIITPIWDEEGNLQGFSKVVRDMTRRRQTEEALRASEARFRTIFEGSAIGIAILDLNGNLLICNPALQLMLGYTLEEIKGLTLESVTHTRDKATHMAMFQELVDGKRELFRHEGHFSKKDGSIIWGNWAASLVRDSEDHPLYAISMIEDITFRKRVQSELLEVQRQLEAGREQERLRLAQELHDDPLQELYGVIYQIEAIRASLDSPENRDELHGMRNSIQNVIDKLRAICGELRPPALMPFGLESAIREHAETFQGQHPEIRLHLNLAHGGQMLPDQLRLTLFRVYQQAIANVGRHAQAQNAYVRFEYSDERVILEVEDDGCGFVVPSNWVNFARKKHLGLADTAERAELLGGKLEVISAPGKGTLIRLAAPRKFNREPDIGV